AGVPDHLVFRGSVPDGGFGKLMLSGRVLWLDEQDERLRNPHTHIRVWVNGAPQINAELKPRLGLEPARNFEVPLVLTRKENNYVEMELPELKLESSSDRIFTVDCQNPDARPQQLHVLIVGVGLDNEDRLREQVATALQARFTD